MAGVAALPRGIVPMQYAFFRGDGRLDLDAFGLQVEACLRAGAPGIAILGLATEVGKLAPDERSAILEAAAAATAGHAPLSVTVFGQTPEEQIAFVREAERAGAASVVLQPPRIAGIGESELQRFFGRVIDAAGIPAGIQNAPEYIGIGLGVDAIAALRRNHPNFRVLKAEGSAMLVRRTIEETGGALAVLNGRAGLELPDNLRAGCSGMIPGAEACDVLVSVWNGLCGDAAAKDRAEALYREVLPLLTFLMQSIDQFLCYGKRLIARRLGLGEVHDRLPALAPSDFGLACLERHAARLGAWPHDTNAP
jgi:dihydrodipicolinate synthase/N-acetylneuraminate lyase